MGEGKFAKIVDSRDRIPKSPPKTITIDELLSEKPKISLRKLASMKGKSNAVSGVYSVDQIAYAYYNGRCYDSAEDAMMKIGGILGNSSDRRVRSTDKKADYRWKPAVIKGNIEGYYLIPGSKQIEEDTEPDVH